MPDSPAWPPSQTEPYFVEKSPLTPQNSIPFSCFPMSDSPAWPPSQNELKLPFCSPMLDSRVRESSLGESQYVQVPRFQGPWVPESQGSKVLAGRVSIHGEYVRVCVCVCMYMGSWVPRSKGSKVPGSQGSSVPGFSLGES